MMKNMFVTKHYAKKTINGICFNTVIKDNIVIVRVNTGNKIFSKKWKEKEICENKENQHIHRNFFICKKNELNFLHRLIRKYHQNLCTEKEERTNESVQNNGVTGDKVKNIEEESIYHLNNKILNRHEQIDICLLNIDEEIIKNLKLLLKIEKLYMYQYIIYNEIIKDISKRFLVYNKTGTGKTLSYLLPLIQKLKDEKFDYKNKVFILTQNTYLCKQLYIYILSIYPNLNVCVLFHEKDLNAKVEKDSYSNITGNNVVNKVFSINEKGDYKFFSENNVMSDKWKREHDGVHFYLCTPKNLEFFIKNHKIDSPKNDKNILNSIFSCVSTIIIDEFDYIVENRKIIFQFFFGNNMEGMMKIGKKNNNCYRFNWSSKKMYLFTANVNDVMKKNIYEYLGGFSFFDFVNGSKEFIQTGISKEEAKLKALNKSDHIIRILSRENKNPSMCSLNISHFICKINSASKYKYVSYFLNEFFFSKKEACVSKDTNNSIEKRKNNQDDFYVDFLEKDAFSDFNNQEKVGKCIIFANSKEEVEKLHDIAFLKPFSVILHSELLAVQKDENINLFKMGKKNILITTDIVSRGMDIEHVYFILNFSPPTSPNDYIHRSGRTGRGKEKGICLTIYHKYEYRNLEKIMKFTKNKFEVVLCPDIDEVYRFSVDKLIDDIMKIDPEVYQFLYEKSEELYKKHKTKIIAQILTVLLKSEKKNEDVSILSGRKCFVTVLIKDPFSEMIKGRDEIINMLKAVTKNKNVSSIVGDIAKCEEGFLVDITNTHVNTIINLFNSTESNYKSNGVEIKTIIELPTIIKENKNPLRKKKKAPWIKYKLQKKKIIVLGSKISKYKKKKKGEIIEEICKPFSNM